MTTTDPTVDNAISLLGAFVMDDGSLFGDIAYPFQLDCAQAVLDPTAPPNRWESRPRGGSKTSDAAAIALAALVALLPDGAEAYCIAADKDQARLLLNDVRGFVQRTPVLASFVEVNNDRVTTRGGSFLQVLAADGPSTWGLKPSLVIADELQRVEVDCQQRRGLARHHDCDGQGSRCTTVGNLHGWIAPPLEP